MATALGGPLLAGFVFVTALVQLLEERRRCVLVRIEDIERWVLVFPVASASYEGSSGRAPRASTGPSDPMCL